MKKSESRASFIFGAIPHSVLRRAKQIKNPTASALLLLLAERTFAFRRGSVDLTYNKIASELSVTWRTIATAARRLQEQGALVRKKLPGGAYRWWLPIEQSEIIADPESRFHVRENPNPLTPPYDRSIISPHDRSIISPMIDRSWDHTFDREHSKPDQIRPDGCAKSVDKSALKKDLKKTDLKKIQQQTEDPGIALKTDDEPLHKFCLKGLRSHGVSQRVARQLCREQDHETIRSLLEAVPSMYGVKNVAGYLVSAIRDGGYETHSASAEDKKNAPQVTGRRSNYAHLTDNNVKPERHKNVKGIGDSPITYRTVEETRQENQSLEIQRAEQEAAYRNKGQTLAQRFIALSDNVKERLKSLAMAHLEDLVPMSEKREEMLQDRTFRRVANRTVLERFFGWVDQGFTNEIALAKVCS